ncbi:hypothetical protein LTR70_003660 [Exophiala xenobiotica]|uniref:GH16 domain-containing protein n=1 Tax=Lithohypha guttulata TaxID=1690604 RepID=A0ABR0KFK3_9EURO|nr:hypothetical protein LTR24_003149 [Lithohypha guttulata]KAK5322873.1 hypothetical protein LTR70_003660 [Exophiala xenobiotica]
MPLFSWQSCFTASFLLVNHVTAFTGSEYSLTYEYSGLNFFDGWDFFTGRDPTGGFVTYYSRSSAQQEDLIRTSEDGPAYMGVNSVDRLPFNNETGRGDGAGRPSVRIASKQAFTHGLFIGDFEHIPAGICGTWPAFWTLGPNWPYTGEVDIMEGVNANMNNVMSLHTNETCIIEGDKTTMTGSLENTNCAYYPDSNIGCGVKDDRTTSFGVGFNKAGGGVYAMQWTSESINIWYWPRSEVPDDVDNKSPDPGSWGLPSGRLGVGDCSIDQHFQSHKIIFDTTFCGEYAGNANVWNSNDANSCSASTGLATCDNYVANNPEAFKDAYWSVNYVRVYQLVDPEGDAPSATYIASEQAPNTATNAYTAAPAVSTPNLDADSLCPQYNFTIITDGKYQYEIACDVDPPGPNLIGDPYPGFKANSMADCIAGCTYFNENNGANTCGGATHYAAINFCYFKKYIDGPPVYRPGYNEIRLIYYGYPQVTDDPRSTADSTFTSVFIESIPTPQTYRPLTTTSMATTTSVATTSSSTITTSDSGVATTLPPAMGDNSTSTSIIPPDYSESVISDYLSGTSTTSSTSSSVASASTTSSAPSSITSTDPQVTNAEFLIAFNVPSATRRLSKRAVQYLAFDAEGQSILVSNEDEAARFYLDADGSAKSGTQFVSVDATVQPPRFTLQDAQPSDPVQIEVDENGYVSVQGVEGFCLTPEGSLAVVENWEEQASECLSVEPGLVPAPTDTSTTTSAALASSSSTNTEGTSVTSATNSGSVTGTTKSPQMTSGSSSGSTSSSVSMSLDTSTVASGSSSTSISSVQQSSDTSSTSGSVSTISTSSSMSPTPTASAINGFVYAGCFGIPQDFGTLAGISLPLTDPAMDNDKCTAYCQGLNAYYAGTHETQCFCGTNTQLYGALLDYPDGSCNTPCPGANRDICGETVMFEAGGIPTTSVGANKHKRQANIILVSLYNNTELLPQQGEPNGATSTDTATVTDTITTRPTSTSLYFPPDQVSYNVTGTNTATVISTTYVDVCPTCPGGLTTKATTITVPHCGCTASYDAHIHTTVSVPSPSVPMVTTVKDCACGHQGAQSTVTVTVPHTSSIQELAAMVTQQIVPGAVAGTAFGAGAMASAATTPAMASPNGAVSPALNAAGPNGAAAPPAANTPSGVAGTGAPPVGEEETSGPAPANVVRPANADAASASPAAAASVVTTPTHIASTGAGAIGTHDAGAAASPAPAPASPPAIAENSGLTNPHASGSSDVSPANDNVIINGAASNATLPQSVHPNSNSNGTFSAPNSPVQSFSSSGSRLRLLGLGGPTSVLGGASRYVLGLVVGALVAGFVVVL